MRNYVIINGVNSLTIQGLAINNLPPITKPMIRTQREEIDGRDGDIVTELGYSAYDKQMEIGLYGNFDIDEIIKYFTGEGTIVFSNEADKYYNFKILDQIDYEKLLKFKTATITLHCQPFKYPLEEEPVEAEITTLTGAGETITLNNTEEAPMKINLKGNTSQEGTPTPDAPQDIHVVSGDNSINVCGKNLLNLNNFTTTSQSGITLTPTFVNGKLLYITSSGSYSGTVTYITLINTTKIKPSTQYRLSGAYSGSARLRLREFDSNNTQLSEYFDEGNGVNFTTKSNVHHIIVQCVFYATNNVNFYPMIVLGTTPTTYEPYIGNTYPINLPSGMELCKIGDYQDVIKKSTGKNLFGKGNVIDGGFYADHYIANDSWCYVNTTKLKAGQTYFTNQRAILSFNNGTTNISYVDKNNTSFIVPPNTTNVYISTLITNKDTLQINEGSTSLPYEPYGTGWYVKKEIGKIILNGSESWTFAGSITNNISYQLILTNDNPYTATDIFYSALCNYYSYSQESLYRITDVSKNGLFTCLRSGNNFLFRMVNKDITTVENWETWLSTHNTIVYYPLATPTYTEITDSTLISQLNALARSYTSQTNISQVNNDLPFELDVSVTFVVPMEINNIGNTYAKPILTIEGTGNIGVVLNDIQILEIDLTNNGKIAIDVTKLEAYNPDDDTLLNRLVTGDYMKLLINEGDNKITFTGEVSGATLTNYIRWI